MFLNVLMLAVCALSVLQVALFVQECEQPVLALIGSVKIIVEFYLTIMLYASMDAPLLVCIWLLITVCEGVFLLMNAIAMLRIR